MKIRINGEEARDRPSRYGKREPAAGGTTALAVYPRPPRSGKKVPPHITMKIRINGEDRNVSAELTLYELLLEMEIEPTHPGIAVAVNREVVPKGDWRTKSIGENSEVEIIRAVQGG